MGFPQKGFFLVLFRNCLNFSVSVGGGNACACGLCLVRFSRAELQSHAMYKVGSRDVADLAPHHNAFVKRAAPAAAQKTKSGERRGPRVPDVEV